MQGDQSGSRRADHWQRKFYQSLDELEQKEKEWSELEAMLRRLATRLTLVADSSNPAFDKQLDTLRSALRNEHNNQRLKKLIDEVTTTISRMEPGPAGPQIEATPCKSLEALLDEMNIPRSLERQERYVRKKLAAVRDPAETGGVVKDVAELLALIIDRHADKKTEHLIAERRQPAEAESGKQHPGQAEKSSLFAGLFGRKSAAKHVAEADNTPAQDEKTREAVEALSATDAIRQPAGDENPAEVAESGRIVLAADTLIKLLEKLQLPDDLYLQADLIKRRLEPCKEEQQLVAGLDATAELVAEMQQRVQQEKQELEDFLRQLTERLHELDQDLRETARLREQSQHAGREINKTVAGEVHGIEQSVRQAVDLESLKTAVQSRVIIIRDHMDRFIESEELRHGQSKRIIKKLTAQLQDTEAEVDALRQQLAEAKDAALRDQLTGIPNRLAYDQRIAQELARFKRYASPFSLMIWDVDKFKNINDTYGHVAGDKVLTIVAQFLQNNVRETDEAARYGGEEFVIILPETRGKQAQSLAEKLRSGIEQTPFHFRNSRVVITASCGIAEVREGEDAAALFSRADSALYRAKEKGRNRIEIAD